MSESSAPSQQPQQTVTFFLEKTASFQTLHADGAIGSITPSGHAFLAFYVERAPIPKTAIATVTSEGIAGAVTSTTGKQGVFRELQIGIVVTPQALLGLREHINRLLKKIFPMLVLHPTPEANTASRVAPPLLSDVRSVDFLDSREFSLPGAEYFASENQPGCWLIMQPTTTGNSTRGNVIKALKENGFDALIRRWVAGSVPSVSGLSFEDLSFVSAQPDHLLQARNELAQLKQLAANWDTYGADRFEESTILMASNVLDIAVDAGGVIEQVNPTSEGTLFVRSAFEHCSVDFEIDDSEIVGVALKVAGISPSYHDIHVLDLAEFLAESPVR